MNIKRILCILLSVFGIASCPAFPVSAAERIVYVCENYDGIATNDTSAATVFSGDKNARVIEDAMGNKAWLMPMQNEENSVTAEFSAGSERIVAGAKIKAVKAHVNMNVKLSGSDDIEVHFNDDATITDRNGKKLGTYRLGDYTQIDIGYNKTTTRYFIALNGRIVSENNKLKIGAPSAFSITTEISAAPADVYVDDVRVFSGNDYRAEIVTSSYTPESVDFEEYIYPEKAANEVTVMVNADFEKGTTLPGANFNQKEAVVTHVTDEKTGNKYAKIAVNTASDSHIDTTLGRVSGKLIFQTDIKVEEPGRTTNLMFLRESMSSSTWCRFLTVDENGNLTLYNGTVLKNLVSSKFTTVTAVCDLKRSVFDVYINGERVQKDVPFQVKLKSYVMLRTMVGSDTSELVFCLDNYYVYDAEDIVEDLNNIERDYTTALPSGAADAAKLRNTVALHKSSRNIFIKDHKETLSAKPYKKGGVTMTPIDAARAFGLEYSYDTESGTITLGGNTIAVGSPEMSVNGTQQTTLAAPAEEKDGVAYIPIESFAEKVLKKKVFVGENNGLIVISDNEFRYKDSESDIAALGTYLFFDRLSAEEIQEKFDEAGYAGVHPRLYVNESDVKQLREDYKSNGYIKQYSDSVIAAADNYLNTEPHPYSLESGAEVNLLYTAREVQDRLKALGYAYLITQDTKYAERAWREMEQVSGFADWYPGHFLDVAEMAVGVAIGYDWCYDYLNGEQRRVIEEALLEYGLKAGMEYYAGRYTLVNFPFAYNNWNIVCNGGMAAAACAVADVYPEEAFYTLENAFRSIEYMMPSFEPEGGWEEGPNYANYTLKFMAYFVGALNYPLGGYDLNIRDYPGVSTIGEYMLALNGNVSSNNFHDSPSDTFLEYNFSWMGRYLENSGYSAMRMYAIEEMGKEPDAFDCIWFNKSVSAEKDIALPLDSHFSPVEAGAMRSSWTDLNGMYVGFHGGSNAVTHAHYDAGAFVLDMFGERWALDLGADSMSYSASFPYSVDNLYRRRAEGHNTIVINPNAGVGQIKTAFSPIVKAVSKERGAYQILDMTSAYADSASSAIRGYMLTNNRRTFIVRDEVELLNRSEVYWFMHTKAQVEIVDNDTAILTIGEKSMQMDFDIDAEDYELLCMEAEPLPTTGEATGEASNLGYRKVAVKLNGSENISISVRITPIYDETANTEFVCDSIEQWDIPDGAMPDMPAVRLYADGVQAEDFDFADQYYTIKNEYNNYNIPQITLEGENVDIEYINQAEAFDENTLIRVTDRASGSSFVYAVTVIMSPLIADTLDGFKTYTPVRIVASANPEDANPEKNAADSDLSTRWAASGNQWLMYDLGEEKQIDAFALAWMSGAARNYYFSIEISDDGVNFTPIYNGSSLAITNNYEIRRAGAVRARYVRYTGMGNSVNVWNSVTEFTLLYD